MDKSIKEVSKPIKQAVKADWKIENVVATAEMHVEPEKIDLNIIARKYTDCKYNPERFPGLIMRFAEPKFTALIFSTGKAVITGLCNEDDVKDAVSAVIGKLKNAKIIVLDDSTFKVQNIVASGNVHAPINLNDAIIALDNSVYEPEVFPGLIYRAAESAETPKAVFLIFSTGRIVCTGTKNREDVEKAVDALAALLDTLDLLGNEKSLNEESDDSDLDI